MEARDPKIKEAWSQVREWLRRRPTDAIKPGRTIEADISPEGHAKMLAYGHCSPIAADRVRGTVHLFKTGELMKQRNRIIKHPQMWNEVYGRDTLLGLQQAKTRELVGSVHQGRFSITLDFAAWFDQLLLEAISDGSGDHLSEWFCYYYQGEWFKLNRLAMGMRQSVDIADTATRLLASFPLPEGVRDDTYIDNMRWIGDTVNDVVTAALTLVLRAFEAGVTINEVPTALRKRDPRTGQFDTEAIRAFLQTLVTERGEFLGVHYDYAKKTVKVGKKAIAKLKLLQDLKTQGQDWTHRNFLSAFGIIFFSLQATRADAAHRYYAMREYSETARRIERDPGLLETIWKCADSRAAHVAQWVQDVIDNPEYPVALHPEPHRSNYILVVDASKWGYGAILLDMRTNQIFTWHEEWPPGWRGKGTSSWAEPEGAKRALLHFFPHGTSASIAVLSDSSTTVDAFKKGRSGSFAVNRSILDFQQAFNRWDVTWHHVPGTTNRADALSRGVTEKALLAAQPNWKESTAGEIRRQAVGVPPGGGSQALVDK